MYKKIDLEIFSCIKDFSLLNGWRKPKVVFGTHPDARLATFVARDRARHYWPATTSKKYPKGYSEFESGKRFDLSEETINGEKLYIFYETEIIEILWRIQNAKCKITDWWGNASAVEKLTVTEIILGEKPQVVKFTVFSPPTIEQLFCELLRMSLPALEELAALLGMDAPSASASAA